MSPRTRALMLKTATVIFLIAPGLIMVTGPLTPLMTWVNAFIDLAYLPVDGGQEVEGEAAWMLNAILGGILVGFGLMIWMAADLIFGPERRVGRSLVLVPLLGWFICDSTGSVLAGVGFNAVLNLAILAVLILPLLWPEGRTQQHPQRPVT